MSRFPETPTAFASSQMVEMDRLLALAGDHPVMGPALRQRREAFAARLREMPAAAVVPRIQLFFSGAPVLGSVGIDAAFAARALDPFLEMVKTQYAASKHGSVGARGPRRGESEARLLLTDLPRGSFGLELSQPDPSDLFTGQQLSVVLRDLTGLVRAAGDGEQSFVKSLGEVSSRVLPRLKDFLGVVADAKAELRIVSGTVEASLSLPQLEQAKELVQLVQSAEVDLKVPGTFRGATLDSWRFDFRTDEGESLSGRLAGEMTEETAAALLPRANQRSVAHLRRTTVTTRTGAPSLRFELLDLLPVDVEAPESSEATAADRLPAAG